MRNVFLYQVNSHYCEVISYKKGSFFYRNNQKSEMCINYSNAYRDRVGICAYSDTFKVGIDIEKKENIKKIICRSEYIPPVIDTSNLEITNSIEASTFLWCLQEALSKFEGTGLVRLYTINNISENTVWYEYEKCKKSVHYFAWIGKEYVVVLVYSRIK